ncbi:MAG TPA: formyltransferase family protein [Patescibacteria group bacterium]|nr:formyltransferase family protein [Patescibacteria group bacterium]
MKQCSERSERNNETMKLAIFASGIGSTAEAIMDMASLVVTNNPNAGIIERAKKAGVPVEIVTREGKSPEQFGEELLTVLRKHQIEFISQNGWELLTPANVIKSYEGKITNNHPAPLDPGYPDFGGKGMKGLAVHQAVLNFARAINRPFKTEIDIHLVTEEFDKGELVAIREVKINPEDSPEILQARLKEVEKQLMKDFWQMVGTTGKIEVIKREERVILPGEESILEKVKAEAITG